MAEQNFAEPVRPQKPFDCLSLHDAWSDFRGGLDKFKENYVHQLSDEAHRNRLLAEWAAKVETHVETFEHALQHPELSFPLLYKLEQQLHDGLRAYFKINRQGKDRDLVGQPRREGAGDARLETYKQQMAQIFPSEVRVAAFIHRALRKTPEGPAIFEARALALPGL